MEPGVCGKSCGLVGRDEREVIRTGSRVLLGYTERRVSDLHSVPTICVATVFG